MFANTKANCELVSQTLYAKGYSCTVLHSGKSQVLMDYASFDQLRCLPT